MKKFVHFFFKSAKRTQLIWKSWNNESIKHLPHVMVNWKSLGFELPVSQNKQSDNGTLGLKKLWQTFFSIFLTFYRPKDQSINQENNWQMNQQWKQHLNDALIPHHQPKGIASPTNETWKPKSSLVCVFSCLSTGRHPSTNLTQKTFLCVGSNNVHCPGSLSGAWWKESEKCAVW